MMRISTISITRGIDVMKRQIEANVAKLLLAGTPKSEVFAQLAGQGIRDSQLAYFIAAHVYPHRCEEHVDKVDGVITLMLFQALFAFALGYGYGIRIGPNASWILGALSAAIPLLFVWGFYTNRVRAYNAYILLSLIQTPKGFSDFTASPIMSSINIAIGLAMLAYVWFVRTKLFPDFGFVTPKKVKGRYVFES